jgi:branched-chain amino acid aminotransferase
VIVPWSRNEQGACAGLKTISYAENVRALAFAEARGAHEAIFPNTRGELCEATGSNVFVVRDGVVRTPPGDAGCLLGVTRGLLLEISSATEEARLSLDDLRDADEAFLSSTVREVQPIASVDGQPLRSVSGPVTEKLAAAFKDLVGRNLDP